MNKFIDRSIIFIHSSFSTLVMSIICVLLAAFQRQLHSSIRTITKVVINQNHVKVFNNIFIIKQINYEFKKIIDLKYLWGMKITLGAISVAAGLANIILIILTPVFTCCPFCCSCCCSMIRESEQENRAIV